MSARNKLKKLNNNDYIILRSTRPFRVIKYSYYCHSIIHGLYHHHKLICERHNDIYQTTFNLNELVFVDAPVNRVACTYINYVEIYEDFECQSC